MQTALSSLVWRSFEAARPCSGAPCFGSPEPRHAQNASVTLRNEEEEDEDDSEVKQDDLRVFVVHFSCAPVTQTLIRAQPGRLQLLPDQHTSSS